MISIIIPFHNEKYSLPILVAEIKDSLKNINDSYEIIFVDDASTDQGEKYIQEVSQKDSSVLFIKHLVRMGKGAALTSGLNKAKGETIIFMDADLQDSPHDIPKFIKKLDEGYDLVNGVREVRKDNAIIKIYSKFGNLFLKKALRSPFTDINCGFKIFRKAILDNIVLYGNNFRFFPLAAYLRGYKTAEITVANRERRYGRSKFGLTKPIIGVIDMLTAYFIYQFSEQPLHFFGIIGGVIFTGGFVLVSIMTVQRIFFNMLLYRRPAFLYAILFIIVGIQIIMTGMIGELIVYLHKKNK